MLEGEFWMWEGVPEVASVANQPQLNTRLKKFGLSAGSKAEGMVVSTHQESRCTWFSYGEIPCRVFWRNFAEVFR